MTVCNPVNTETLGGGGEQNLMHGVCNDYNLGVDKARCHTNTFLGL